MHLHTAEACFNNTTKHCFHGPETNGKPQSYAKALSQAIDIIENHEPEPLAQSTARQIRAIVEEAEKQVSVK
jgi:hypothetical protein